ncbi:MAG: hypothetical protein JW751_14880 [Polyangiaceae bacterium]|nr:hypothetical protein [Polyangiaceae bacterium]
MRHESSRVEWCVLGALVVALLACKGGSGRRGDAGASSDRPKGEPLTLSWEQSYKLATGTKAGATFFATKGEDKPVLKLQASFHDFPKGTKVKLGTTTGVVGDGGYWSTLLDLKPAFLGPSLEDLKGPVEVGIELELEPPGAPIAKTTLPAQNLKDSLRFALIKARDGGLSFGTNDQPSGKARSAAVIAGYSDLEFIGSGKGVAEVDWVVLAENRQAPRTTKKCTFKEGPVTLQVFDASVLIFERRTGTTVEEQVLKASEKCPMFAMVNKAEKTTKNTVNIKDVVAWARGKLGKAK